MGDLIPLYRKGPQSLRFFPAYLVRETDTTVSVLNADFEGMGVGTLATGWTFEDVANYLICPVSQWEMPGDLACRFGVPERSEAAVISLWQESDTLQTIANKWERLCGLFT